LEQKFKKLLNDFEGLDMDKIEFVHLYDVYALFQQFDFLNISKIAGRAGINPGLMRQYASGVKHPSLARAKEIENVLHELAAQMGKTLVYAA
jgi:transcriptional regulator with XRE-family HTH domain